MSEDRRSEERFISVFKAAYIEVASEIHFVTLKNISRTGVGFSGYAGLQVGERVRYCLDTDGLCEGRVKWVRGASFGVESENSTSHFVNSHTQFPPRSVRLPVDLGCTVILDNHRLSAQVHNISLRGICVSCGVELLPGEIVTVALNRYVFDGTTVRWQTGGRTGLRFAHALDSQVLRSIAKTLAAPGPAQQHPADAAMQRISNGAS